MRPELTPIPPRTPNERIEANLGAARAKAALLTGHLGDDTFEECHAVCLLSLTEWANEFDPAKSPNGEAGFGPFVVQRMEWAWRHAERQRRGNEGSVRRNTTSLDDPLAEGSDTSKGEMLADARQEDPAAVVEVRDAVTRRPLRLSEVQARVSKVAPEAGSWAGKLRAACYDALSVHDMVDIMDTVKKRAKKGDLNAVRLLLDYFAGGRTGNVTQTVIVRQDAGEGGVTGGV